MTWYQIVKHHADFGSVAWTYYETCMSRCCYNTKYVRERSEVANPFCFCSPVFRRNVLRYGTVRPSGHSSASLSVHPSIAYETTQKLLVRIISLWETIYIGTYLLTPIQVYDIRKFRIGRFLKRSLVTLIKKALCAWNCKKHFCNRFNFWTLSKTSIAVL